MIVEKYFYELCIYILGYRRHNSSNSTLNLRR